MYTFESFGGLKGPRLNLHRLKSSDFEEAFASLFSADTWVVGTRGINSKEKFIDYLKKFEDADKSGEELTLIVRLNTTNEIVGLSRYYSSNPGFTKIEIGYTWIADRWMKTFVNTEKKFLMVHHAFETMKVKRVEFSVDPRNEKSNTAMRRIGGQFEGTLRKWRFFGPHDPGHRNIYSIIDDEWPQVKLRMERLLSR